MPGGFWGWSTLLTVSPRGNGTVRQQPAHAYATWSLIALTTAIYLIQIATDESSAELILRFGVTPEIFNGGERPFGGFPIFLTPLSAMFLHGSWDHLLGNLIYLWVFGDDVEEVLGPYRFALLYVVSGVCGALGYIAMDGHASVALVGGSGCVSGVIVAYLMLKPCEPVAIAIPGLEVRIAMFWAVGSWLLLQLFQFLWHTDEETFSTLAQAGGTVGGAAAFWLLCPAGIRLFQCIHARNDHSIGPPD